MTQTRSLKKQLIASVLALVMLISSLIGTTFAWFTDSVTSAGNQIISGNLKIDLRHKVGDGWISLKENTDHLVFDYDNWEPGFTASETLEIVNLGSLALQYKLSVSREDNSATLGKNGEDLADIIDVYVSLEDGTDASFAEIQTSDKWVKKGTLKEVLADPAKFIGGELLPTGETLPDGAKDSTKIGSTKVRVALHMQETAGNEYQNLSVGNVFVNLIATQHTDGRH